MAPEILETTSEYIKFTMKGQEPGPKIIVATFYANGTYFCENEPWWKKNDIGYWELREHGRLWWRLPWLNSGTTWEMWSNVNFKDYNDDFILQEEVIKTWLFEQSVFKKD